MQTNQLLLEAIALRKCVRATYNRMSILLAPHILFSRHDALFIEAITIERDGQPPKEIKLGTFNLAGLKDLELTTRRFDTSKLFDPNAERPSATTLFMVELAEPASAAR